MIDTFPIEARNNLSRLSDKAKLLFGALTCDHLFQNYVHFQETTGWGNSEVLRESIDTCYQYLIDDSLFDSDDIQILIDSVDLITPDTADFPEITSSYALDACTAVLGTLKFILEPDLDFIVDVAVFARDTVDMYVQIRDDLDSNDPSIEHKIDNDPLMIRERKRQSRLIEELSNMEYIKFSNSLIQSLKSVEPIINIDPL